MNKKIIFNIHFYLSSFFTPFLMLIALTGTLYLFGEKGSTQNILIKKNITFQTQLDKKIQITEILNQLDQNYRFEYIKDRGSSIQTRPTTRNYYNFKKSDDGTFILYRIEPNFLSRIIEVHKGHGPKLLKDVQKVLGIGLLIIILTGLLMSLQIKPRVKPFIITSLFGFIVLTILFYL